MRIGVFGLGNVLRRDDGFGPSAVRYLEAHYTWPAHVTLADLGTPGLDLPSFLVGHEAVLLLDTALGEGAPGTIHIYGRDDLFAGATTEPRLTGHEADLRAALTVTGLLEDGPREVCLIGVVPQDLGDGMGLSPPLVDALEPACRAALAQLAAWGAEARRRAVPTATGAWWQGAPVPSSRSPQAP